MSGSSTRPLAETVKQYGHAVAGGLLFSVAAMYTMEIWWLGFTAPPHVVLATFVVVLGLLVLYAHYAGVRKQDSWVANVGEAIESLALGFLVTAVVLKLAGQLPGALSAGEAITRLVMTGVYGAIGVSVGTAQLGSSEDRKQTGEKGVIGHELALSALGAILIGSSVAPTEEILMIGVQAHVWELLALALLSYLITLGVVQFTDLIGKSTDGSVFADGKLGDACVMYAVGLVVSAAMLWASGRLEGMSPSVAVAMTVVLGLPCGLGASSGRVLL